MDTITFQPYQEWRGIDILINGRDLINIMREVEQPFVDQEGHPDLAGDYARLWPSQFFDLTNHFLSNHQATLLVCGACGLIDCVRLDTTITITNQTVQWHNFVNSSRHKPNNKFYWDYGNLQFTFNKKQYKEQLEQCHKLLRSKFIDHISIYPDPQYGWAIYIFDAHDYFQLPQGGELVVDGVAYPCLTKDKEIIFWQPISNLPEETEQKLWRGEVYEHQTKIIYLPHHPHLLREWLTQFLDLELCEQSLKSSAGYHITMTEYQDKIQSALYSQLAQPAELKVLEPDYKLELRPLEVKKYREIEALAVSGELIYY